MRWIQTALLCVVTLVGLLAALAMAADWLQGLETWFWDESVCSIESSVAVSRPEYGDSVLKLRYRYQYRGETYVGEGYRHDYHGSDEHTEAMTLASRYPTGGETSCWVDPEDPARSYLLRSDLWQGLWLLLPLIFVAAGAGGLWLLHRARSEGGTDEEGSGHRAGRSGPGLKVGIMVVLFGLFFLFGAGFLVPFFIHPALQVMEARTWQETECEILSSEVRSHPGDDSTTYSVEVFYRYRVDGRELRSNRYQFMGGSSSGYESKAKIVEALAVGETTVCWFDPEDPFEAVIERGFTPDYLFGLVPLVFALIGLGGLAVALRAMWEARRDAARPSWAAPGESSWGRRSDPTASPIATSGSSEQLTLEPVTGPLGKLGCTLLLALGWNGFISIFVWQIYQQWKTGNAEWFAAIVVAPFVLIGLLLLISIPYSILALVNPRPRLRLTPGSIRAGDSAQLEWSFRGRSRRVRKLRIWLEASTTETSVRGSSVRIQTRRLDTPAVEVVDRELGMTEQGVVSFAVPPDTPPSSTGEPAITWKVKLHGDIAYWPDVNEEFPVEILPNRES